MAELAGYRTAVSPAMQLPAGLTANFTWRIAPAAYRLMPVVVTETNQRPSGAQTDFYNRIRQRAQFGHLITRDQIERLHPFRVSDLLRTVPGIQVVPGRFGDTIRTTEGCVPAVFLDGLRFPLMGESIDDLVNPNDVEMIEVYPHATGAPVELTGAGSACGVVAIWTRRG
jgi:outer membrane cobalamin receptor